jgi:NitT/TauT family transport system substrate-binding protein
MKKISSSFLSVLFVLLAISTVIAYWIFANNVFGPTTKVVVGPKWVNQAQFAGIYSAKEQYIYRKYGLDVEVKEFDFETNQFEDLMNGKTDFAILSAEEVLLLANDNEPIKAVAAIYQVSPYAIVSLAEAKIETPADFKNKVLGNKGGKLEGELIYKLLLNSVGLNSNDSKIKSVDFEFSEYEDLINRKADAVQLYRTDQLYYFDKKAIDYDIIYPEHFGIDTFNDIIITKKDFIEKNPEVVGNFIAATVEGWNYSIENPERSVSDTMKYVTHESYRDYDYELFILNQSIPLIKPNVDIDVGSMTSNKWKELYESMVEKKLVKDIVLKDFFTTEFLP